MHMAQVGPTIKAEIIQLTPKNFHHFMGSHLYNMAWLDFNSSVPGCGSDQYLNSTVSPNINSVVTNSQIIHDFTEYDNGQTLTPPSYLFSSDQQAQINQSNFYWHQRLNNSPCFTPWAFKQFDDGSGNWTNITQSGFFNLVALAQQVHQAALSITAISNIQSQVNQSSTSSFFTKTVTTTVSYYVTPQYYVGTRSYNGTYYDIQANPTWIPSNNVSFVSVQGQGASTGAGQGFDSTPYLVYQYSQSQSGWTGLFCFLAIIVIFTLAAVGVGELLSEDVLDIVNIGGYTAAAIGIGIGAVGGLIAAGGSPTTGATANITPFVDSAYDLSPAINYTGDQAIVQQNTDNQWLDVNLASTPGGLQTIVTGLDLRKALACGGPSGNCVTPIVSQVGMSDPRFQQTINSMFRQPTKILEGETYPYATE